jgi:hypothetical protein
MFRTFLYSLCLLAIQSSLLAQEVKPADTKLVETTKVPDKSQLYKQLEETLTGAKFIGRYTTLGKEEDKLKAEEYTIVSAKKAEHGEFWLLMARIKYGDKDATIPVPIEILWAGTTPVMTLDKISLYGVGTFSARVVINDGKYAGTWQHDSVGGHLFGKIEKAAPEKKEAEEKK